MRGRKRASQVKSQRYTETEKKLEIEEEEEEKREKERKKKKKKKRRRRRRRMKRRWFSGQDPREDGKRKISNMS